MSERARSQEETRLKIVEATMHLHEEIGPRATTISAIAEKAGVQRLTVYRHFPDETAVFQACTSHWLGLNPPPDPASWNSIEDPWQRFRTALGALYAYFSRTRRMWSVSHRDVADVPALQAPMQAFFGFLETVSKDLAARFPLGEDHPHLAATLGHAVTYAAWEDLDNRQIDDREKVALVERWVRGVLLGSPAD